MAGHKDTSVAGAKNGKEGMSSEPTHFTTPGGVLMGVAGFQNGIPGNPPAPKMRGDAKPVGSNNWPQGGAARNKGGPALGAFGIKTGGRLGKGNA